MTSNAHAAATDLDAPKTFSADLVKRASGGFAVRSGLRAGRAKTSDKHQQAMLDYIKS